MQYFLLAEHPRRTRPMTGFEAGVPDHYVPLSAGNLSDAAGLAATLEGKTPLLRIHLTDARPVADASEMALPPRSAAIVSLIHDASLLEIAYGAVITGEDDASHRPVIESAARTLAGLGYSISSRWEEHSCRESLRKGAHTS